MKLSNNGYRLLFSRAGQNNGILKFKIFAQHLSYNSLSNNSSKVAKPFFCFCHIYSSSKILHPFHQQLTFILTNYLNGLGANRALESLSKKKKILTICKAGYPYQTLVASIQNTKQTSSENDGLNYLTSPATLFILHI